MRRWGGQIIWRNRPRDDGDGLRFDQQDDRRKTGVKVKNRQHPAMERAKDAFEEGTPCAISRARQAVKKDLQGKRQQISSLMLRLGRIYPGKTTWGPAHMRWLMAQKLEHLEQRIAFEELLEGYARKASAWIV